MPLDICYLWGTKFNQTERLASELCGWESWIYWQPSKKGCTVFITGIIQGQISYLTCYFREINGTERLMWINAMLNVIIKSCVSLSNCRSGGYVPVTILFFSLGRSLAEEFPFPCLVAGIARHFERKVVMVFIDPRCPASPSCRSNNAFCSFK